MGFPEELKKMRRWVGYRLVPDKDGGKPRKVPVNAVTGRNAKSNAPEGWTDYETARAAAAKYGYSGVGFMFLKGDGLVGIDIDHCYDPATGEFNEVAKAVMGRQPTYTEFSPSGDGVHVWLRGEKPKGASKNTETGVEMYDSLRYFTVTEKQVPGTPDTVEEALPDTLPWIHENFLAKRKAERKNERTHSGCAVPAAGTAVCADRLHRQGGAQGDPHSPGLPDPDPGPHPLPEGGQPAELRGDGPADGLPGLPGICG